MANQGKGDEIEQQHQRRRVEHDERHNLQRRTVEQPARHPLQRNPQPKLEPRQNQKRQREGARHEREYGSAPPKPVIACGLVFVHKSDVRLPPSSVAC
jgi:hypothetical protein